MKKMIMSLVMLTSFQALAAGGQFYCETDPGSGDLDGVYVSGTIDGEAQVTNLVVNYGLGDGLETSLDLNSISLTSSFELNATEHLEDDSTLIGIVAPAVNGQSRASFSFQNSQVVTLRKGTCTVSFKAGI